MIIPLVRRKRYRTNAVVFDGANDWLTRGAELSGNADGKAGILSVWMKFTGGDATAQRIIQNGSSGTTRLTISKSAGDKFSISGLNAAGSVILTLTSSASYTSASGWKHFLASWNLATALGQLYVNDASDLAGGSTLTNDTIDYTLANFAIGAHVDGTGKTFAEIADLYLNLATSIDLSVESNRRKFISASRLPVDLGASGATPTGTSPIVFLKGTVAGGFATNKGTGGGFTTNGTLTDAATSPSD